MGKRLIIPPLIMEISRNRRKHP